MSQPTTKHDQASGTKNKTTFMTPGDRDVLMERTFDAPAAKIYKAYADPSLIPSWWGPASATTKIDRQDFRVGGKWRYVQRDAEGEEYGFHGEYREVVPDKRIVQTFEFEGMPGKIAVETVTFEESGEKTKVKATTSFPDKSVRDTMLAQDMESGARESWERLDALLNDI